MSDATASVIALEVENSNLVVVERAVGDGSPIVDRHGKPFPITHGYQAQAFAQAVVAHLLRRGETVHFDATIRNIEHLIPVNKKIRETSKSIERMLRERSAVHA